jgi:hypothetical protein
MANNRSSLDQTHILQLVVDEELEALQVSVLPMEMAIELNANDGDSVLAVSPSLIVSDGQEMACLGMKKACLYGEGVVSISPEDSGDSWYQLNCIALEPMEICARRIKLNGPGKLVVNG